MLDQSLTQQSLTHQSSLYQRDFLLWTQQQAEFLRSGVWSELDVDNLVEELETLGRSEQKELGSYLRILLMHLLKTQFQPERKTNSWKITLCNSRDQIQDCLEDMPSLYRLLGDSEWLTKYYQRARRDAAKEIQLPAETFPVECPYTVEQILDQSFLPETLME